MPAKSAKKKPAIFRQVCELVSPHMVSKLARKYEVRSRRITPWNHVVSMIYAQFAYAISLNDYVMHYERTARCLRAFAQSHRVEMDYPPRTELGTRRWPGDLRPDSNLRTHKMQRDVDWREECLSKARKQLEDFNTRLQGPRCRFRTKKTVTDSVEAILKKTSTSSYITYKVTPHQEIKYYTVTRGEITRKHRRGVKTRFRLEWNMDASALRNVSKSDGVFPLITNRHDLSALDLLVAYRTKQPVVEQRHDLFKNILEATPAYLQNIGRLEALLFLEFVALMVHALIERHMRQQMKNDGTDNLPIYPEGRPCKAPTTTRLIDLFAPLQCHCLIDGDTLVQHFPPELSELHHTMATLAGFDPQLFQNLNIHQNSAR